MQKNMKSSRIKKVVVKVAAKEDTWEDYFEVDSEIHDDFLLEAATRALDKRKHDPNLKLTPYIQTWEKRNEKNPMKCIVYNSYLVMINAAMHKQAEYLRSVYLKRNKIDLRDVNFKKEKTNGDEPANN